MFAPGKNSLSTFAAILVISGLFLLGSDPVDIESNVTTDGPHIYRQTDSTAIVFYLCNDSLITHTERFSDTLKFTGLCHDSGSEYVILADPVDADPYQYTDVSKIMALSDIHGDYEHLREILTNSGVVNDGLHWAWGDGHLVIVGDVFDRGNEVTECLWLIYRLQSEAEREGGRVHFLLGNHELMILRGDARYVHEKYLDGIVEKSRIDYKDLFGLDMVLGRWLRTCPAAVEINDIMFVHGGISVYLTDKGYDINRLNLMVRENIDIRSSQLAFDDEIRFLFGGKGPFWYRGYHYEMENRYPMMSEEEIADVLDRWEGEVVVVGHTEVDEISRLHGGKVIAIDVPVEKLGGFQALLWDGGEFYIVGADGKILPLK